MNTSRNNSLFLERVIQKSRLGISVREYSDIFTRKSVGIVNMEYKVYITLFPFKKEVIVKNLEFWS